MIESIQSRCAIEEFCAQLIAEEIHTSKGQRTLKEIQKLLEKQECLALKAADNTETLEQYLIHLTTAKALLVPGRIKDTLEEHSQFYSALKAGKADAAYKLLMAHLIMPLSMDLADNECQVSAT